MFPKRIPGSPPGILLTAWGLIALGMLVGGGCSTMDRMTVKELRPSGIYRRGGPSTNEVSPGFLEGLNMFGGKGAIVGAAVGSTPMGNSSKDGGDRALLATLLTRVEPAFPSLRGRTVAYFCSHPQAPEVAFLSDWIGADGRLQVVVPRTALLAIEGQSAVDGGVALPGLPNVDWIGFSELECGLGEESVEVVLANVGQVDFAFPRTTLKCLHGALVASGDLVFLSSRAGDQGLASSWSEALEASGFRPVGGIPVVPSQGWVSRFSKVVVREGGLPP